MGNKVEEVVYVVVVVIVLLVLLSFGMLIGWKIGLNG